MRNTIAIAGLSLALLALSLRAETNEVFRCQVKVLDAQGQPVSGAIVEQYHLGDVFGGSGAAKADDRKTTDQTGTFSISNTNQGYYVLLASKPGMALTWGGWFPGQIPGQEEGTVDLLLKPAKAVGGIVQDAAGKPVADALVWVKTAFRTAAGEGNSFNLLPASLSRSRFSARTGADGKFAIDGLPENVRLELAITKPGLVCERPPANRGFDPSALAIESGQKDVVLKAVAAGAVVGKVVKLDGGAPAAGVSVSFAALGFGGDDVPSAVSDAAGVFRFGDLEPGEYVLQARVGTHEPPDLVCAPESVTVQAGATNHEAKLELSGGGLLEVTVKNSADEQPIPQALVYAMAPNAGTAAKPVTSSAQGVARFRLPPGDYQTYAAKAQSSGNGGQVTVELGKTNQTTVLLAAPAPSAKLVGVVRSPDGQPAPRVEIILFPLSAAQKKTDARGRFEIPGGARQMGAAQNYQQVLIARDPARDLAVALDIQEDATNADLKLEPALTLAGQVTDPDGKPVTNAEVAVMFWTQNMGSTLGNPAKVDARGKFEVKGLPPGRRYGITASAIGFGQDNQNVEAADTAKSRLDLDPFQLPPANLRLAGTVLDANDKPVAGAVVNSYGGNRQPQLNGRTDAQGHFAFEHVCSGTINLSANGSRGGQYGNTSAEGGDTNVTIHLGVQEQTYAGNASKSARKINGVVLNADGKPAAKVSVCLFPSFNSAPKKTDEAGQFSLLFDPNQFGGQNSAPTIIARDLDHNLAAAVDVEEEATNTVLRLAPGWTLAGRATATNGAPLTNAQAQLNFRTDRMSSSLGQSVRVDKDGKFEIPALPAERRFSVTVTAKGYGEDSHEAETGEGDNRRVELEPSELLVADQRIAGQVLDSDDKPVKGAWLYCYGAKQTGQSGQSDAKGHFVFTNVCSGELQISANSQNGSYGNAKVEAGDTNIAIHLSNSGSRRANAPRAAVLRGKPLPDLAATGLTAADTPADQPVLVLLIDAEQRPCRRVLRLLGEQAATLKQKGLAVVVLHSGDMAADAFAAWKQEAALPFPVGKLKPGADEARTAWGAGALPWFILTDKAHKVIAEGFGVDELEAKLGDIK